MGGWVARATTPEVASKQLHVAQERVTGLMVQHDFIGSERDMTLRRLNEWFANVKMTSGRMLSSPRCPYRPRAAVIAPPWHC